MVKKDKKPWITLFAPLFVFMLLVPQIVFASWWNPLTWKWSIFSWVKPHQVQIQKSESTPDATVPVNTPEALQWRTYINDRYDYTIMYPPDWTINTRESEKALLDTFSKSKDGYSFLLKNILLTDSKGSIFINVDIYKYNKHESDVGISKSIIDQDIVVKGRVVGKEYQASYKRNDTVFILSFTHDLAPDFGGTTNPSLSAINIAKDIMSSFQFTDTFTQQDLTKLKEDDFLAEKKYLAENDQARYDDGFGFYFIHPSSWRIVPYGKDEMSVYVNDSNNYISIKKVLSPSITTYSEDGNITYRYAESIDKWETSGVWPKCIPGLPCLKGSSNDFGITVPNFYTKNNSGLPIFLATPYLTTYIVAISPDKFLVISSLASGDLNIVPFTQAIYNSKDHSSVLRESKI